MDAPHSINRMTFTRITRVTRITRTRYRSFDIVNNCNCLSDGLWDAGDHCRCRTMTLNLNLQSMHTHKQDMTAVVAAIFHL